MHVTAANLTAANLRSATTVTLGAAMTAVREYGHTWAAFVAARPELVCPIIPAAPLRDFLITAA